MVQVMTHSAASSLGVPLFAPMRRITFMCRRVSAKSILNDRALLNGSTNEALLHLSARGYLPLTNYLLALYAVDNVMKVYRRADVIRNHVKPVTHLGSP